MSQPVLQAAEVARRLKSASDNHASRQELLDLTAELIHASGEPYTGVYLYMLHDQELVLEAHRGRDTDHTRIRVGQGVCGTAVATGEDQNVPDVRERENYLACNAFTRSELVVLIRSPDGILGQIDIDSDSVDPFNEAEVDAVRQVAEAVAVLL